jgi:hypothetical protein
MLHESTDAMRVIGTTRGNQPSCARGGIVVANLVRLLGLPAGRHLYKPM